MIEILYSIAATAILIAAHTLALSMPFSHNQARTTARLCMIEKALAGLTPRTRSNRMAAFSFIDGPVRNKTIHCDTHEAHGCCRDQFARGIQYRINLSG